MRVVDLLRELQDVDTQLDVTRGALEQIQAQLGDRSSLAATTAWLAEAREVSHRIDATERDLELEAASRREKIKADETKLYGGKVTNSKELASLSDEIGFERKQLDVLETKLLELLDDREAAAKKVAELEAALERQTESLDAQQAQSKKRAETLKGTLGDLDGRRKSLADEVQPPVRTTYDLLRRQKGGMAVASVLQRTCQACRVGLTPAIEQRARIGNDLTTCTSCGRILFVPIS